MSWGALGTALTTLSAPDVPWPQINTQRSRKQEFCTSPWRRRWYGHNKQHQLISWVLSKHHPATCDPSSWQDEISHSLKKNVPEGICPLPQRPGGTTSQCGPKVLPVPSAGWASPAPPPWSLHLPPWRSRQPSRWTGPSAASRRCSSGRWLCRGRRTGEAWWQFLRPGCFAARLEGTRGWRQTPNTQVSKNKTH